MNETTYEDGTDRRELVAALEKKDELSDDLD
jgi:hypothetical protein